MSAPVTCARCRRRFGGSRALELAHTRRGCRPTRKLEARGLWRDAAGVWHRRGSESPGQLRLPLWGRGRPHRGRADFSVPLLRGSLIRVEVVSRRPWRVRVLEVAA